MTRRNFDFMKYFVEHGADIHANSEEVLRWSVEWKRLDAIKYLIEKGANIPDDLDIEKISVELSFEIKLLSMRKNDVIYIIDVYISKWLWKP